MSNNQCKEYYTFHSAVLHAISDSCKHLPFITANIEDTEACLQKPNANKCNRLDCAILIRQPRKTPTCRLIKLLPFVLTSSGKIFQKSIEGLKEICRKSTTVLQAHGHEYARIDASALIGNTIESALRSLASQFPTYNHHGATPLSLFDRQGSRDGDVIDFINLQRNTNKLENIKKQEAANQRLAGKYWDLATSVVMLEQLTEEDDEKQDGKKKNSFQQAPPNKLDPTTNIHGFSYVARQARSAETRQ